MVNNCTANFMEECTYNLSKIFNNDIINAPQDWIGNYNLLMGGYPVIIFLAVVAILLYIGIRQTSGYDSEAGAYSGIITTVFGLLLFLISLSDGTKLISWVQLVPFIVLTFLAIIVNCVNRNY